MRAEEVRVAVTPQHRTGGTRVPSRPRTGRGTADDRATAVCLRTCRPCLRLHLDVEVSDPNLGSGAR